MTDEQLQQIREKVIRYSSLPFSAVLMSEAELAIRFARELLAEAEQAREIVQAVANLDLMWTGEPHLRYCAFCDAHIMAYEDLSEFKHTPDCSVIKARALLAKTGGE